MNNKILVVLSGGQDSTTCLYWALNEGFEVYAVTFDYGQRHDIEVNAAESIAQRAGIPSKNHCIVTVPDILLSASPLLSNKELEQYSDFDSMAQEVGDKVEDTFVPMRNAFFLTIAANIAVNLGCEFIVTGANAADTANYPDCTESFIGAAQVYINKALGKDSNDTGYIRILTPLQGLHKKDIVKLARTLPGCYEALAYTHTSYDGRYPPTDMNHANVLRAHGFEEAGFPDPLVLRAHSEGLMDLPKTKNYDLHRG